MPAERQRSGLASRAETVAFTSCLPSKMVCSQRSGGPVGDEEDYRRAAVTAPLVAETGGRTRRYAETPDA